MEENKQILELLEKIEKNSRQQLRTSRLLCLLALALVVLASAAWLLLMERDVNDPRVVIEVDGEIPTVLLESLKILPNIINVILIRAI